MSSDCATFCSPCPCSHRLTLSLLLCLQDGLPSQGSLPLVPPRSISTPTPQSDLGPAVPLRATLSLFPGDSLRTVAAPSATAASEHSRAEHGTLPQPGRGGSGSPSQRAAEQTSLAAPPSPTGQQRSLAPANPFESLAAASSVRRTSSSPRAAVLAAENRRQTADYVLARPGSGASLLAARAVGSQAVWPAAADFHQAIQHC